MSKKSKKELAKAEAAMLKALKMQAKAQKMKDEAARMQLAMIQASERLLQKPREAAATAGVQVQSVATDTNIAHSVAAEPASTVPDSGRSNPDPNPVSEYVRRHWLLITAVGAAIILAGIFLGYTIAKQNRPVAGAAAAAAPERRDAPEKKAEPAAAAGKQGITILDTWEMPDELREISSNAFIDADRVACIQDNDGIIYTYNLKTRKVESRLQFGKGGDYEALSVVGNLFYALRSDGLLFEVQPSGSGRLAVKQYQLPLRAENETEPMVYDQPNNRLLVGVKEKDPGSSDYKGVYAFDLRTKTMALKPVMTIPATHGNDADEESGKKKKARPIKPSEIAIDPRSGDLYVLNGPHAEFLIVDPKGNLKQTIQLDKSVLPQPEGMCFSPAGELYISSEGGSKKGTGVIVKAELK